MSGITLYDNPRKKRKSSRKPAAKTAAGKKRRGGFRAFAKTTAGKIKTRARKLSSKIKVMDHIVYPASMVLLGILATKAAKNFIVSKFKKADQTPLMNPTLQNFTAAGLVAAVAYFTRKWLHKSSVVIASALALPILSIVSDKMPALFAGIDEMPYNNTDIIVNGDRPQALPVKSQSQQNEILLFNESGSNIFEPMYSL